MLKKKKNRIAVGIISLLVCLGCTKKETKESSLDQAIEKLIEVSKEDGYSDYMYLYLFKKGNTANEYVHFDIDELRRLYFGKHIPSVTANLAFDEFLREVIENRITLTCDVLGECFYLNENIQKEYKILGFSKFKEKYTSLIFRSGVLVLKNKDFEEDKMLSIIYIFYLNNYFTEWADYEGGYFSTKMLATDIAQRPKENYELETF
ncbi:hypothetical protein ACKUSY_06220 [Myroides odoratus]